MKHTPYNTYTVKNDTDILNAIHHLVGLPVNERKAMSFFKISFDNTTQP